MGNADPLAKVGFAHMLRGLAALVVLVAHLCQAFWTLPVIATLLGTPAVAPHPYWFTTLVDRMLPPGFLGNFGVALFFLISGFVIPFSVVNRTWPQFAVTRVLRIWPTYAIGLTITALMVILCAGWFGQPRPFSWNTYFLQLIFLQDLSGTISIDGIVWTLEIEARFYLMIALLAGALRLNRMRPIVITAIVLSCFTFTSSLLPDWLQSAESLYRILYGLTLTAQMLCFMLVGTVFNLLYRQTVTRETAIMAASLFLTAFAMQWALGTMRATLEPGLIAYGAALGLFASAYAFRGHLRVPGILNWLAGISYSLYVIHGVAGYAVIRIAVDLGMGVAVSIAVGAGFAFTAATLLHHFVEVPTQALGKRLAGRLKTRQDLRPDVTAAGTTG
jgi:peptidoglycan/LPS O-acetylase OafA/YrhL